MANIILRTNTANRNFSVEHKVLQTPITESAIELIITPKTGLNIKADKFTVGYLPKEVSRIEYVNFGNNVIAKVYLNPNIQTNSDLNILLPISGVATTVSDRFELMVSSSIDPKIITSEISPFSKSTDGVNSTYNVNNSLNKKTLILIKNIVAPDNTFFATIPTYTIEGNASRYQVVSKINKNLDGNIVRNTIEVYYTSPKEIVNIDHVDSISFAADLSTLKSQLKDFVAVKQEDYKLYSINTGGPVGNLGGIKRILIKGVAGTPFSLITSNTSGETYNFTTGVFEAGGGGFDGIIPAPVNGFSYGSYTLAVKVPRSSTTVTTNVISSETVDHSLIIDAITIPNKYTISNLIFPNTSMTIEFISSGFEIPPTGATGSNFIIGPGVYKELDSDTYVFDVFGTSDSAGNGIIITRQPRHSTTSEYVNWDSGDATKEINSAGVAINNDWYVADDKNWGFSISAKVTGVGERGGEGQFESVRIKGIVSGVRYGEADITLQLDLLNFLTLAS